jgi:hypothetical protein
MSPFHDTCASVRFTSSAATSHNSTPRDSTSHDNHTMPHDATTHPAIHVKGPPVYTHEATLWGACMCVLSLSCRTYVGGRCNGPGRWCPASAGSSGSARSRTCPGYKDFRSAAACPEETHRRRNTQTEGRRRGGQINTQMQKHTDTDTDTDKHTDTNSNKHTDTVTGQHT